ELRVTLSDLFQNAVVPVRIGADRRDIELDSVLIAGSEGPLVHSEGDELDRRSAGAEPVAQPVGLAFRIGKERRDTAEGIDVETTHPRASTLHETLGQADRGVDERRSQ